MTRSTAFFINGGAGRVITSIPAFEKFEKENPEDDFIIVCEGGTDFYKGHPTLGRRTYDTWHKNLFEQYIKDRNCVSPEPYRVWEYYNQQCSLAQAFDIAINNKGIREVAAPVIYLNKAEMLQGKNVVDEVRNVTGFNKVIVLQPFGRTIENIDNNLIDTTSRSFQVENMLDLINTLKKEYAVMVMSEVPLGLQDDEGDPHPVAQPNIPNIRIWAGVINEADHFLGCDSLGQHIAKALGTNATVVTGSTYPINTSYINDPSVDIIDSGEGKRVYSPIRITSEEEPDRLNDKAMDMTKEQINAVVSSIRKRLGKSIKSTPLPAKQLTDHIHDENCRHGENI
tara:strand:+ start:2806 stop:3825 length:1020 start_codon:yes stop_codon:yes gene_type:complete